MKTGLQLQYDYNLDYILDFNLDLQFGLHFGFTIWITFWISIWITFWIYNLDLRTQQWQPGPWHFQLTNCNSFALHTSLHRPS